MRLVRQARPYGREKLRQNVIEWLRWLLQEAEIADLRYPVKGTVIYMPYGMKLRRNVEALLRRHHDETGHHEVLFPIFIPYEFLAKESEHIRGFEKEVFWVSKGGEAGERLVLRPTSETAIMPMARLWIRDYKDLPLRLYQIVNVFRAETKTTHPMIRVREISMFKEAHTVHADREDAERQVKEAVEIYRRIFDEMCLAYLISRRPEWDKFAGAVYTIAFDTVLPDGRTLQIGTVHYLGTNFARVFEVTYLTRDGGREYAHTTSYGISERSIAAMLIAHGDDQGTTIPPRLAPIQAVLIPIYYTDEERSQVLAALRSAEEELRRAGVRVALDDRADKTPGWKFYYWELKGVPLRVEVGRRDLEAGQAVVTRRDTLEKYAVPLKELVDAMAGLLREVEDSMRRRAWEDLRSRVAQASTLEEARAAIREGKVVEVPWSGDEQCGLKAQELVGADALGVPLDRGDVGGFDLRDLACADRRAQYWLRLSERY